MGRLIGLDVGVRLKVSAVAVYIYSVHSSGDFSTIVVGQVTLPPPRDVLYHETPPQIVKTTPHTPAGGWGGSKVGLFWGGITVQGLLPYYYEVRRDFDG